MMLQGLQPTQGIYTDSSPVTSVRDAEVSSHLTLNDVLSQSCFLYDLTQTLKSRFEAD